jgi:ABC-type lipoprotein release transport system permease subunit
LLLGLAFRNLSRQRRRTVITVSAMALSLAVAIPTNGLMDGLAAQMLEGITGMDLGHVQVHDPAYPRGRTLQSTLRQPGRLLEIVRGTPGVQAAAPRVSGHGLASHDVTVRVRLAPRSATTPRRTVGRDPAAAAPWRRDPSLACEVLAAAAAARRLSLVVGSVLSPKGTVPAGACERLRVVGFLAQPSGAPPGDRLPLWLDAVDLRATFGPGLAEADLVLRRSAPVSLQGVDPAAERRVTFMAHKITQGRYLGAVARGEIVVGHRLARGLGLEVGGTVFVQAATLDPSAGAYYQDLRVVGVYRTGVDLVDRSRVFVHLADAQRLMGLEDRIHEVAVVAADPRASRALAARLRQRVGALRLTALTSASGRRAGSRPLPAPVTVIEPRGDEAALVIPYDLKRRLEDLAGVARVAQRVYGQAEVSPGRAVTARVVVRPPESFAAETGGPAPTDRCGVVISPATARALGLAVGQRLVPPRAPAEGEGCAAWRVERIGAAGLPPAGDGPARSLVAARPPDGDETEAPDGTPATFLVAGPGQSLRFVGVEPDAEARLPALGQTATALADPQAGATEGAAWPVLVTRRAARQLHVTVGDPLLVRTRDAERREGLHAARVAGLIEDATWPADRPELVLPLFPAQRIDLPTLDARAHEMVLLPRPGTDPVALARSAEARFVPLVRTWNTIAPEQAKILQASDVLMAILLVIVFAVAALTVMNTMLMAVWERTRELGVLMSLGLLPRQVFGLIVLETVAIAAIAIGLGGGLGLALNHWMVTTGLDLTRFTGGFTYQGTFIDPVWRAVFSAKLLVGPPLLVGLVCLLASFYPALRAARLNPVEASRQDS